MAHAVVAMFDPAADAEVRTIWATLCYGNIDSSMMTLGVPPHLTLAVIDDAPTAPLIGCVNALAARTNPFTLIFDRVDMFEGKETVLYLAPQASTALRKLHGAFHESAIGIGTSTDHTRPGTWVPHATIAMALRKRLLATAHRILSNSFFPFDARVTDLAVIRFSPVDRFQGVTKVHQVSLGAAAQ